LTCNEILALGEVNLSLNFLKNDISSTLFSRLLFKTDMQIA